MNPETPRKKPNEETIDLTGMDAEDAGFAMEEEADPADVSGKVERASAETRREWQKMEQVNGRIEEFSPDLSVQFDMRKDQGYRPGDEPGEDMFLADKKTGLTGVFDGLGGEGGGDAASAKAAETAPRAYEAAKAEVMKNRARLDELGADMFARQAELEHPDLREAALKQSREMWAQLPEEVRIEMVSLFRSVDGIHAAVEQTKGMTTLTLGKSVALPDGRMYEVIVNVGDSGAFKVREDGSARDITREDSALDAALAKGLLSPEQAEDPNHVVGNGTKAWSVELLRRGMYQALGGQISSPRITVDLIRPGEKVVYVTDGIRDIKAFEMGGRFDSSLAAEAFKSHDSQDNLASALAGQATAIERKQRDAWGTEESRAALAGRAPDKRLKPKLDEKTVLVKERAIPIDDDMKIAS